jgi:RNA polymerase sigma-70 factor, ECF subfamily
MASTSQSLLDSLRVGPQSLAWQRWHAIYEPLIHAWMSKHRFIPTDRDDVTQNVMIVVVQKLNRFEHNGQKGAFRKWLKSITINCLRDYWKKLDKHPQQAAVQQSLDEWAADQSTMSQNWEEEHDRHVVQKLLALLEPEFTTETWQAFQKVVVQGRTAEQVAKELSITKNAVYIAKSRVLTRLRQEAQGLVDEVDTDS